jgi:hypothetical protein
MSLTAPPRPPLIAIADEDRFNLRFRQIWLSALTILVTVWLCTLGWIPAIIALVTAKHILVAILVMGLGVDAHREPREPLPDAE